LEITIGNGIWHKIVKISGVNMIILMINPKKKTHLESYPKENFAKNFLVRKNILEIQSIEQPKGPFAQNQTIHNCKNIFLHPKTLYQT